MGVIGGGDSGRGGSYSGANVLVMVVVMIFIFVGQFLLKRQSGSVQNY